MHRLPNTLAPEPTIVWEAPLGRAGLGGIAATERHVFFGDRDLDDFHDVYRCLDAATGDMLWEVQQLAIGQLDYGNSPRATPLIHGENVIFFGAFGDLVSIEMASGQTRWQLNLRSRFQPDEELPWGYCGSPLLVDGKLIVNPGAADASLVAIDPQDGSVLWTSPGLNSAYGSFIAGQFGGRRQIVGHDARSIGGWDIGTGQRLWTIAPPFGGEFNVPTPVEVNGSLLVSTEQNGTRLYDFKQTGEAKSEPVASNIQLTPDMSSSVVVGDLAYCVNNFLYCLDVRNGLKERWRIRDKSLSAYGSIIASGDRVLVVGDGELLLFDAGGEKNIIARQRIFEEPDRLYSFPALVGSRLFVRGESRLRCIELK